MKKYLSALMFFGVCMSVAMPQASAQTTSPTPKKAVKKTVKKAASKKKADAPSQDNGTDEDEKEPDITTSISTDFQCALGDKITIFENTADEKHIALRWKKRVHRLTRVGTTTGANRFENHRYGLVWIGIPAKGMLLDSKKGQQLANDCKNAEQMKAPAPVIAADSIAAPMAGSALPAVPEASKK
jgi:hypothetical protein